MQATVTDAGQAQTPATGRQSTLLLLLTFLLSSVLFAASLNQDCMFIDRADNPRAWAKGWALVLLGWLTVGDGIYAWLANPAIGWVWCVMWFRSQRAKVAVVSVVAVLLILSFQFNTEVTTNTSGDRSKITGVGLGYWLWLGSAVVLAMGNTLAWWQSRETPPATTSG